jgi:hypothetical protein
MRFTGTRKIYLSATRLLDRAGAFLQVEGASSEGIVLDGGDLGGAAQTVAFKDGAMPASVKLRA